MRRHVALALGATILIASAGRAAGGQESLLPSTSWGGAPAFSMWHFATPIAQSAGSLTDVQQFALPLRARALLGERWTFDLSGAAASSSVTVQNGGASKTLTLRGLTDVKLRLSGSLIGDVLVTAGVNVPTGTVGLDADQTSVLQAVGAPALHMPVGALGIGPGATLGVVAAHEVGSWALALGGSVEQRTEYTPIELVLASGKSLTKVTPGTAAHVTLGADHPLGEHRLALLFVTDAYAKDQVKVGLSDGADATSDYQLGPQMTGLARIDLAAAGWREANTNLVVRYRSNFSDATGATVAGSRGTYVEGALSGIRGGVSGLGVVLGVDARYHTGLTFTDALVGAAARAAGVTLGVEIPSSATVMRFAVRGQYGQFNTGTTTSNGMGVSLVWAIAARREAQR